MKKKLSYVVRDAEKPSKSCTFFVSISLPNGISLEMTGGYIAFIVVFCNEYETNLHFIFDWTTEWKITWKWPKFIVRNRPNALSGSKRNRRYLLVTKDESLTLREKGWPKSTRTLPKPLLKTLQMPSRARQKVSFFLGKPWWQRTIFRVGSLWLEFTNVNPNCTGLFWASNHMHA